jgi:hypothetical protein
LDPHIFKQERATGVRSKSSAFCNSLISPHFQGYPSQSTDPTPEITKGFVKSFLPDGKLLGEPGACRGNCGAPVLSRTSDICGLLVGHVNASVNSSVEQTLTTIDDQQNTRILPFTTVRYVFDKSKSEMPQINCKTCLEPTDESS